GAPGLGPVRTARGEAEPRGRGAARAPRGGLAGRRGWRGAARTPSRGGGLQARASDPAGGVGPAGPPSEGGRGLPGERPRRPQPPHPGQPRPAPPAPAGPRPAAHRWARPPARPRATSRAPHPPRRTPRPPRGRRWCGPAPPPDACWGRGACRHVTGSDLAARRHGGLGPGSGALGSRRRRGDGGSRSRSGSSRRSGGRGRGSGSRSAARAPCAPAPPSACGAALRPQDGRRVRGPGLRGQRPDHRGPVRGAGRGRHGAQPPAALREAAYPAKYIVQVDGKIGLFRGLSPRLMSNALSTVTRGSMKKVFPPDEIEQVTNKDDMKTSLKKVVKETSYEMMMQCVSRMLAHPLHVISMRCMVQFVGREAKYSGVLSSIGKIFKEEGLLGFFVGLIPHLLGDVVFLWGCNLLAHFINAYLVDDSVSDTPGGLGNDQNPGSQFSQALAIRSYTKFVMGIAVSMLTYPFLLVGDLMAVNNCGLQAGLPPYSPVFKSWIHCWKYLSVQGQLFRGSSLLFRRVSSGSCFALE
uniref:Mitochondrial carrier homolog 1 n=1 Tax=Canis lupus familiaris TaxID=9615 RepID=A0A8C0RH04_CANLF